MLSSVCSVQVLQAACRALRVSDVGLIVPSIEKLAAAVALLPRLERFARAVCSTLLPPEAGHHSGGGGEGEAGAGAGAGCAGGRVERRRVMEDALPVLERWRDLVGRVEQAGALKDALAAALSRRAHMQAVRARGLPAASAEAAAVAAAPAAGGQGGSRGGQGGQGDDDGYGGQTSQGDQGGHGLLAPRLTNAAVVKEVEELVALEAQLLSRHQSFAAAERALELNPDLINNRIVLHFQYLFQVLVIYLRVFRVSEVVFVCAGGQGGREAGGGGWVRSRFQERDKRVERNLYRGRCALCRCSLVSSVNPVLGCLGDI